MGARVERDHELMGVAVALPRNSRHNIDDDDLLEQRGDRLQRILGGDDPIERRRCLM